LKTDSDGAEPAAELRAVTYYSHAKNGLPDDTDFTSYGAFKQSLTSVILIKFCKVYFT